MRDRLLVVVGPCSVHDVEAALFRTSLGVSLESGTPVEGGHRHHMRAINTVRLAGSLKAAVADGTLTRGIIYEAIMRGVRMVLAGSVRDDGPIPDVITDMIVAQRAFQANARTISVASELLEELVNVV